MNVSVLRRENALMPQKADGLGAGALIALLVHAGLLLALAFGVNWRASEPVGVTAELWASVPQFAAPPAAEPPQPLEPPKPTPRVPEKAQEPPPKPAQRDADIAIEKERERQKKQRELEEQREKAQKEKLEKEKAEKEKADKAKAEADKRKKQQEEEARLAKLREENLKRLMGQVGGTGAPNATGSAARDAGPSASYVGRVGALIKSRIHFIHEVETNPRLDVDIRTAPDGTILGAKVVKSSGIKEWDEAVLRAIESVERLPRDTDGRVPSVIPLSFRPKDQP